MELMYLPVYTDDHSVTVLDLEIIIRLVKEECSRIGKMTELV